ncbi:MAG: Na(+)/H(+) antiporter subunit D [Desulfobacca sp.]|nr:Na(+)/H(+) antiporter subunit D [Desulfobacca sp.]
MNSGLPPALVFIGGALVLPFLKGRIQAGFLLLLPVIGFLNLLQLSTGIHGIIAFWDYQLILARVDRLSLLFGYIFHLVAFLGAIYALHVRDDLEQMAGLVYAGSALGVVFAGDLLTLFVFWELLTVSSVFLIWNRRTRESLAAGFRYLLVHVVGGLCLLAGVTLQIHQTGSLAFEYIGLNGLATYLIFFGVGVNCAWPLLHPWLTDAYPEATVTGVIWLSAFTTKTAVYVLARGFPGTEVLIWIGTIMTAFPIFYAVIENDLRRVLAYSLINQVGFMVCGIGIGTPLAINGAISHAFNDILFKALLFMSIGAVLYRTGTTKATDLGGLYKTMPLTCICCIVGAASISAFPLFSGFVSKSMVMEAAALGDLRLIWFILLFASAGVLEHAGIKVPFFAFFSHDSGLRPKEAPWNMSLAMVLTAGLCIFIGSFPGPLYSLLPYPVDYEPYTAAHVIGQLQLLLFAALAFPLLLLSGIYPAEIRRINLDADWFYRRGGRLFYRIMDRALNGLNDRAEQVFSLGLAGWLGRRSRDLPFRLALLLLYPLWLARGLRGEELRKKRLALQQALADGASPLGIGAAVATAFLLLFIILSGLV